METVPSQPPREPELRRLRAEWPRFQFWVVERMYGGPVWCARPHDNHKDVLNAGSPTDLEEKLEERAEKGVPDVPQLPQ